MAQHQASNLKSYFTSAINWHRCVPIAAAYISALAARITINIAIMTFKVNATKILLVFLFSCQSDRSLDTVVLKIILTKEKTGHLINKYVYLVDDSQKGVVDSALVKGDTITFTEPYSPGFVPHLVSVQRIDTFQGRPYLRPIGIQNPYIAKTIYSSFYLDKGVTILKPYFTGYNNEHTAFIGSKQNEPFFKNVELQFTKDNGVDRSAIIAKNVSKIKAYRYSIHLLKQLFYYKDKFLNDDLKNQLSFFDDDIKKTPLFESFSEYFTTSSMYDKAFPLIEFENQNGSYQKIHRDGAAYYLIVYWASWCGPCRKEIPDIVDLYTKFNKRGLAITSISIDGDKHNWNTALQQEKMPWQQLIAIDSSKAYIDLHYNIKAIPKAYLFNGKKELIKTFDDALMMTKTIDQLFENAKYTQ
ncbi:TlpA family protein disulfide reductase [Segetibacter aerophilus]|uniref:Thioredoxin domain-containing protein n=1 Tax=Segetibacter aerophilus TaxID=670293 RepID=A0A512BB99_9BACT|nr:TlpA disulfide reductase family protein [Segetibacter aerophilus]GEO09249.1 hypothetical protein SAE01_17450 [Segetibacter aerophilus]